MEHGAGTSRGQEVAQTSERPQFDKHSLLNEQRPLTHGLHVAGHALECHAHALALQRWRGIAM